MTHNASGSLGLGIDCGGTYTDAVVYHLEEAKVLASAKFPTTHRDLTLCIEGVLDKLPADLLAKTRLVCLSTTLATNAIVERRGGRACLLLVGYDPSLAVAPYGARVIRLRGGHDVRGTEVEPLDEEGLRRAVLDAAEAVDAFAVSSYFSVRNPEHEIRARAVIAEETGRPVICGHELSMQLDALRRATTAAINARLIPLLASLISSVKSILSNMGITAPLMVVRGDGTLMGDDMALERPVETILSGPAASVVGALTLSGRDDGVVIDVGGTTTDIAWVEGGLPPINAEGAVVGGLATRVEAIDIRTIGLGGDSWVRFERGRELTLGPRRVIPIALLPDPAYVLAELERLEGPGIRGNPQDLLSFWIRSGDGSSAPTYHGERDILARLEEGPLSHRELKSTDSWVEAGLRVLNLEQKGLAFRATLTPTDIFNAEGLSRVGNPDLSLSALRSAAALYVISPDLFVERVRAAIQETITGEVLSFLLAAGGAERRLLRAWSESWTVRGVRLSLRLERDILAAGAPAALFLKPVAEKLSCSCVIPPYVEVANAVGAVAGVVSRREEVILRHLPDETYRAFASDGRYDFRDLDAATEAASSKARELAAAAARQAGAGFIEIDERREDFSIARQGDEPLVMERKVSVRAFGRPRLRENDAASRGP